MERHNICHHGHTNTEKDCDKHATPYMRLHPHQPKRWWHAYQVRCRLRFRLLLLILRRCLLLLLLLLLLLFLLDAAARANSRWRSTFSSRCSPP